LKHALLGYATMDILEYKQRLVFGTWNPRPLRPQQVKRLVDSFHSEGLERFDLKTVIPVVISPSFVDISSLAKHPTEPEKLPPFSLLPAAPKDIPIKCAGGRHRLEAVVRYINEISTDLVRIQEERDAIARILDEDLTPHDLRRFNKETADEIRRLGGIQKYGGQWMVAVYDEGMKSTCLSFTSPSHWLNQTYRFSS
ncbi:hypothetical protein PAXRUDRAFT_167454, partial [Paxillus rubicundulus Ve08.2h10]